MTKRIFTVLSLALMSFSLSGCVALLIGGAAGGATGYYLEKQQEPATQQPYHPSASSY